MTMTTTATARWLHSYVGDGPSPGPETTAQRPLWLLFVRRRGTGERDEFVFTAVVPSGGTANGETVALYELALDTAALEDHIEELGIEVDAEAFRALLTTTLESRQCVDLGEVDTATGAELLLTYKFSASISRRGRLVLKPIAASLPLPVLTLLLDLHHAKNVPVLTELQRLRATPPATTTTRAHGKTPGTSLTTTGNAAATNGEAGGASAAMSSPTVNPLLLRKRHMPAGTVRRKGPRGAKLAKLG